MSVFFEFAPKRVGRWAALAVLVILLGLAAGSANAGGDKKLAQDGKSNYYAYCVNCHGANMVNSGTRSYDLRKFPLNAKARFFKSVKNGKKDMPAWKDVLQQGQIEELWAYMKTRGKI